MFARGLAEAGKFGDAATFCAYLLPRRESVWWACRSVRTLLGDCAQGDAPCLLAAEAWAQKPDEEHREAALRLGEAGDGDDAATWLAKAAGWAGGMIAANPKNPVPVPALYDGAGEPYRRASQRPLRPPSEREARLAACVADAVKLAETGL